VALSRRQLLTRGAAGAGVVALGNVAGVFGGPLAGAMPASSNGKGTGYGKLVPDPAGLLDLPPGFHYSIVSIEGQPLPGGGVVPGRFDGTGAFAAPDRGTFLVRNSEYSGAFSSQTPVVAPPELTYDPGAPGGTTTVHLDKHNAKVDEYISLGGTSNNCAGGLTPWGTWLTCEEDTQVAGQNGNTKDHGFIFEVDPANPSNNVTPTPLQAMGRLVHEAVVIDPDSGWCYETEDASGPFGLVYRFVPDDTSGGYGSLRAGGALSAMACSMNGTHVPTLHPFSTIGTTLDVTWKPVPDPAATSTQVRAQFADTEVTRSRKLEGAWFAHGRAWIVSSFREGEHAGQVWSYDPDAQTLTLELFLAIKDVNLPGESPDNITISPYGGMILAEDGDDTQYLLAVDANGNTTALARNAFNESEFTGPVFSPDHKTLFANIQELGHTFAITGPFSRIGRE
jgi:hypothetical protein